MNIQTHRNFSGRSILSTDGGQRITKDPGKPCQIGHLTQLDAYAAVAFWPLLFVTPGCLQCMVPGEIQGPSSTQQGISSLSFSFSCPKRLHLPLTCFFRTLRVPPQQECVCPIVTHDSSKGRSTWVHLDCQYGLRAQKPYHTWVLGTNSIMALYLDVESFCAVRTR